MEFDNLESAPTPLPEEILSDFEKKVIEEESIDQLAAMYRQAYDDVEEYARLLKIADSKKTALGEQFCKVLLANGLNSVKTDDGSFAPKVESRISIVESEVALAVIEEAGHGAAIKRKIEWMTLNKIFREEDSFKHAVASAPEGTFKTWDVHGIRIRRAN